LLAAAAVAIALTSAPAERHLLDGARHFREARFAEALVEFRMAAKLGEREAAGYAGAALVKLERWEEAVEAFGPVPAERDALLDWYRALALDGAGLHASADALLATLSDRSGPRLAAQAAELRSRHPSRIAAARAGGAAGALRARSAQLRAEGRTALADAMGAEAVLLERLDPPAARAPQGPAPARPAPGGRP
jgi:hypothetical protein